ncbi:conserved hypothetical protein [Methylobacterium nodulans ORS 2060]|uniref:TTHB210-like domain-containing protein n=2 Tax=Methylobacterium nodulans TaxID=114616 RepID=B8IA45_METNO|nr:conserved hypothetical protein [Methylobacterium nodulans ORS 2060]
MVLLPLVFSAMLSSVACVNAQERQICIKSYDLSAANVAWTRLKSKRQSVRYRRRDHQHFRRSHKRPNERRMSEQQGYRKVSSLVNLPSFLPGIGVLYVRPETLPVGPFRAFDRQDRLVSTIYMIPIEDFENKKTFDLQRPAGKGDHVTMYFNAGHAGVEMPHYHIVIWHVSKKDEARVAP